MIKHDKCEAFEKEIERLKEEIKELNLVIDKLKSENEQYKKQIEAKE